MKQLTYNNSKFKTRSFPVVLVCDNVVNAPNIGSLFRICDAFGVEKLILCGDKIPIGRKMMKTSRATEKTVNYSIHDNASEVVQSLSNEGYYIVSLEVTNTSLPLHRFEFSKNQPIALVVGNENFGISQDILLESQAILHIDMFGQNSSMNVVQAANICLYEITKQLL